MVNYILSNGSLPWKAYFNYLLKDSGGEFLFRCNYDVEGSKIYSKFYNEFLQWWADFRESFSTKPPISKYIIWNNKDRKIDNKSIYYPNYVKAGILFCHHLQFDKDNIQSYNNVRGFGVKNTNFLVWTGVRGAIPSHLKTECLNENELGPLEFVCQEKTFNPLTSKSKQFYRLLVSMKVKPNAFRNIKSYSSETFIRSFQFKLLAELLLLIIVLLK